jgi:hypothetical protein
MTGIPVDVLEFARARGVEIHEVTELIDLGHLSPNDTFDPAIEGYIKAYLLFKEEAGFEVTHIEEASVCPIYRYGGTCDRRGFLRRYRNPTCRRTIDIKNVATVSKATELQCTAYSLLDTEFGDNIPGSVQLRADGSYRYLEYDDPARIHNWYALVRTTHIKLAHGLLSLEN